MFSLSLGLAPFIEPIPSAGKVGTSVTILGNSLTGTTAVTFNGVAASFKVTTATTIVSTVPVGATTGSIKVVTPKRTLLSNVPFRVN